MKDEWSKTLPARSSDTATVSHDGAGIKLRLSHPAGVRLTMNQAGDIAHALLEAVRRYANMGGAGGK